MIIQIGTEVDESRILWKHNEKDDWRRADIDDLIIAYESRPIRCKDCRWFRNDDDETWCVTWAGEKTNPDAFCSYAKPKEKDENI